MRKRHTFAHSSIASSNEEKITVQVISSNAVCVGMSDKQLDEDRMEGKEKLLKMNLIEDTVSELFNYSIATLICFVVTKIFSNILLTTNVYCLCASRYQYKKGSANLQRQCEKFGNAEGAGSVDKQEGVW